MYAAILSDHEIPFSEIRREITRRGWTVVGKQFEQFDDIPAHVMIWIMCEWKTFAANPKFPWVGYVRIATEQPSSKTSFLVVNCSWLVWIYYHALMWTTFNWEKLRLKHGDLFDSFRHSLLNAISVFRRG